ncbi:MAG: hypothetical protein JXB45_12960 [Candidatus Krumholzibacteriota bacterium]|nr:hypothetical protein [Candidatus Krumholzibacteriota bacterium]
MPGNERNNMTRSYAPRVGLLLTAALILFPPSAQAERPLFGIEEIVPAGGLDIEAPGCSVPSLVDWNEDGLDDLVIGEGGGGVVEGKVRIYLNSGSPGYPVFNAYFYVQSLGADLVRTGGG